METFIEQLEVLKRIYTQLPEDQLSDALDLMDQYLEQMGNSTVFVVADEQVELLVNAGQSEVNDFLGGFPSTSGHFSTDFSQQNQQILYCYTCGASFNNRKALYRHGKNKEHRTREHKYTRPAQKPVGNGRIEENSENNEGLEPVSMDLEDILSFIGNEEEQEDTEDAEVPESSETLRCFECKRVFGNRKALYRHGKRSSHTLRLRRAPQSKGGPVGCPNCEYRTANLANLRRHLQRSHNIYAKTPEKIDKKIDKVINEEVEV